MPKYRINDDQGNTLVLEGDSPPTEQELEEIFSQRQPQQSAHRAYIPNLERSPEQQAKWESLEQQKRELQSRASVDQFMQSAIGGAEQLTGGFADLPKNLYNLPADAINMVAGRPVIKTTGRGEPIVPEIINQQAMGEHIAPMITTKLGKFLFRPEAADQIAGLAKGVEDLARGMTTPEVAPTMMAGGIGRLLGGVRPTVARAPGAAFAGQMAQHTPEAYSEFGRLSVEGAPGEGVRAGVGALGSTAAIVGIGAHNARPVIEGVRALTELATEGKLGRAERMEAGRWLAEHNQRVDEINQMKAQPPSPERDAQLQQLLDRQREIGLSAPHQKLIEQIMEDSTLPVEVVWGARRKPGQFAGIRRGDKGDPDTIEIYGETVPNYIEQVARKRRGAALERTVDEEFVHAKTDPRDADLAFDLASPLERWIAEKNYGLKVGEKGMTERDLGYELIRQRIQKMSGGTREAVEASFEDRLDIKALELLSSLASRLKERRGRQSRIGRVMERTIANIEAAKAAKEAAPKQGPLTPEELAAAEAEITGEAPENVPTVKPEAKEPVSDIPRGDAADLAREEAGGAPEPDVPRGTISPNEKGELQVLQAKIDSGEATSKDQARFDKLMAKALGDNPAAQKQFDKLPFDEKKVLAASWFAKMRADKDKFIKQADKLIKDEAQRGKPLPGDEEAGIHYDNPAAISKGRRDKLRDNPEYDYYVTRLINRQLVDNGIPINTDSGRYLAVPVGGNRKSGYLGCADTFSKDVALKIADELRVEKGFPNLRVENVPARKKGPIGPDDWMVVWGDPIDFNSGWSESGPSKSYHDRLGKQFGYKEYGPEEQLMPLEPASQKQLDLGPAAYNKADAEKVARETIIGLESEAKAYRAAGKNKDADELEGYAETLKRQFPGWDDQSFPAAISKTDNEIRVAVQLLGWKLVAKSKSEIDANNALSNKIGVDYQNDQGGVVHNSDTDIFEAYASPKALRLGITGDEKSFPAATNKLGDEARDSWNENMALEHEKSYAEAGYMMVNGKIAEPHSPHEQAARIAYDLKGHSIDEFIDWFKEMASTGIARDFDSKEPIRNKPASNRAYWRSYHNAVISYLSDFKNNRPDIKKVYANEKEGITGMDFPAAYKKPSYKQQQADKLADLRRAAAEGREAPGLKPPSGSSQYSSVEPRERIGATESGAIPSISAADLERAATQQLAGEIKIRPLTRERSAEAQKGPPRVSYDRPSFDQFLDWAQRNMEGVRPAQLRDLWQDKVWSELLRASPERLEDWRKALGLESHYGRSPVAPAPPPETTFRLEQEFHEGKRAATRILKDEGRVAGAKGRYRNKLVEAIGLKLVQESVKERPDLSRSEITTDDIDFSNQKTEAGPYRELSREEISDPQVLNRILRDQARPSSVDPESASRRLVAVVDNDGRVMLLNTYNDAGVQRVMGPTSPKDSRKPYQELNAYFIRQYRPFATVLLSDPVQAFRQKFESVSEFMDKIGKEALDRSRVGEFPGEGPAPDFEAEGTPGLEGEGGLVMGPSAGAARASMGIGRGVVEQGEHVPMTPAEAASVIDHVVGEVGRIESTADIDLAIQALKEETNPLVLSGYRKLAKALQDAHQDWDVETLLKALSDQIYETYNTAKTGDEFIQRTLSQTGVGPAVEAPAPAPSKTARELTTPGRRTPIERSGGPPLRGITGQAAQIALARRKLAETPPRRTERLEDARYVKTRPPEQGLKGEGGITGIPFRDTRGRAEGQFEGEGPAATMKERAKDLLRTPIVPVPEAVLPDTGSPIPRFIPNVNTQLTKAMGVERIPLIGRIWGPRAKMRDAVDKEILGYSVKRVIGRSQSNLVGHKLQAEVDQLGKPFQQDKDGFITNVTADQRVSMAPSDLFEEWQRNPNRIDLTPEQKAQFESMLTILKDGYDYLAEKNAKLDPYDGEQPQLIKEQEIYKLPRIALYKRDTGPLKTELQRRIGGQYQVERDRLYKTEEEGQKTTAYEPDMVKRVVAFVDRVYKAVADADLAHAEVFGGKTPQERVTILAKRHEADLRSGKMSQQDIIELSQHPYLGKEARVEGHPAFSGKIYDLEISNRLNKAFSHQTSFVMASARELSTLSKALILTGDAQQYFTQGAPMMLRRPGEWAHATAGSLRSVLDPNVLNNFLSDPKHYEAATELAQLGVHLGHNQEFLSGTNPGELATRIPIVKEMVTRSGRAFGTFFDMAKVLQWEALREVTPKEEWPAVARTIENIVLSGGHESTGLHPARAAAEQVMFMAAAYYRSAIQLVASMAEKGVAGKEAQKILGTYLGGMVLGMTGAYLLSGMSWDEIRRRLHPGLKNKKFLMYPVKVGGETIEMGPGGIILNLASLITDLGVTAVTDPKKLSSYGSDNPMVYWLSTKLGPVPSAAIEARTGKDLFGNPTGPVEAVRKMATPMSLQQAYQAGKQEKVVPATVHGAAAFIGVKTSRGSAGSDIHELARKFIEREGLEKETGWELSKTDEASYGKMRYAIMSGDQSEFNSLYKRLLKGRTDKKIEDEMEHWANRAFSGSKDNEGKFLASLTDEQHRIYAQAQHERQQLVVKFKEFRDRRK